MILPTLISVSEAPGSYFFCAAAGWGGDRKQEQHARQENASLRHFALPAWPSAGRRSQGSLGVGRERSPAMAAVLRRGIVSTLPGSYVATNRLLALAHRRRP